MAEINKIAIFLFILCAIASAGSPPLPVCGESSNCLDNATCIVMSEQGVVMLAVIALIVVVIAASYMLGSFLQNPAYIVFAKDEAYHLAFSLVILVALGGIILFLCNMMNMFYGSIFEYMYIGDVGDESACYYEGREMHSLSSCYLDMIENDAKRMSQSYIENYIGYLMDSTFTFTIQIPLFNSYTASAGAYRRIIPSQYDMILNMFLVPSLMSISMQKITLDFINENAIQWILPAAFVLRFFPPTRQMGNILIALAIGLYVIIPFMYVFNLSMYEIAFEDCNKYADIICDNAVDGGCSSPESTCENPDSFWNVARLIPQAIFLPNLTIAIFITYLASANKALRVIG